MQDNNNQEAGNRIDTVSSYLDISNIPEDLGRRVRRYYRHYFSKKTALDECLVLDDLSASLRLEVSSFLVHDMLLNDVMIFKLVNPIHWAGLLPLLRPCIFNKDEVGWLFFFFVHMSHTHATCIVYSSHDFVFLWFASRCCATKESIVTTPIS
jgi:hypothetical protein